MITIIFRNENKNVYKFDYIHSSVHVFYMATSLTLTNGIQSGGISAAGAITTTVDQDPAYFDMAIGTNSSGGIRYHAVWSATSVQFSEKVYYAYSDVFSSNATWTIVGDDNTVGDPIYLSLIHI